MTPTLSQGQAEPSKTAFNAMCGAWSLCPTDMPHLDRMRWMAAKMESALAASSAAPTADLRAAVLHEALMNLANVFHEGRATYAPSDSGYVESVLQAAEDALDHPAAAQLAAVAAPEARIEKQEMGHPAAPGSLSAPSAAPLSEPCALDQGARPVRMLTADELFDLATNWFDDGGTETRRGIVLCTDAIRKFCEVNGIAPPVAQPGSTK